MRRTDTLWMVGWWLLGMGEHFLSQEVKTQKSPKPQGSKGKAITFVLRFLITSAAVQKWVTAARDSSNILQSSDSVESLMGLFSPRCQHRSPISKLTMFSAEELKSFVASPLFCSFMMTDCVSLRACRGRSSIRYCACLAETKGYFGLNTSPPHIHRSLCKVIHHL